MGETRTVHANLDRNFAYITPYASVVGRSAPVADGAFPDNDKVIHLSSIERSSVRRQAAMSSTGCTTTQKTKLEAHFTDDCSLVTPPCPAGCIGWEHCEETFPGTYSLAGVELPGWCRSSWTDGAYHYAWGWTNESCPYVCEDVDMYAADHNCVNALIGQYVPSCNNTVFDCSSGSPVAFPALLSFTSAGYGTEDGCAMDLSFPCLGTMDTTTESGDIPFTIELWVSMDVASIPSPLLSRPLAILAGSFPRWYVGLTKVSSTDLRLSFYHSDITDFRESRGQHRGF